MHYACEEGNIKIVELLIKSGININLVSNQKQNALHIAAKNGYFDISKLLISKGINIKEEDKQNNTAAHLCAKKDNLNMDLLIYLVEKSPSIFNVINSEGKKPVDLLKSKENKNLLTTQLNKNKNKMKGKKNNKDVNIVKIRTANQNQADELVNQFKKKNQNQQNSNKEKELKINGNELNSSLGNKKKNERVNTENNQNKEEKKGGAKIMKKMNTQATFNVAAYGTAKKILNHERKFENPSDNKEIEKEVSNGGLEAKEAKESKRVNEIEIKFPNNEKSMILNRSPILKSRIKLNKGDNNSSNIINMISCKDKLEKADSNSKKICKTTTKRNQSKEGKENILKEIEGLIVSTM